MEATFISILGVVLVLVLFWAYQSIDGDLRCVTRSWAGFYTQPGSLWRRWWLRPRMGFGGG